MVATRERRRTQLERLSIRLVATGAIIGIAVVLGAVLVGQDVAGWIRRAGSRASVGEPWPRCCGRLTRIT
jgi:hypothetical protein